MLLAGRRGFWLSMFSFFLAVTSSTYRVDGGHEFWRREALGQLWQKVQLTMEGILVIIGCASRVSCIVLNPVVIYTPVHSTREKLGHGFVTHTSTTAGLAGGRRMWSVLWCRWCLEVQPSSFRLAFGSYRRMTLICSPCSSVTTFFVVIE